MYAIIKTGGKQYRVAVGDVIHIEKVKGAEDQKELIFDEVLAINNEGDLKIGAPVVEGAAVKADILEVAKADKVVIYKFKRKEDYRKKQGHRQPYMSVKITAIEA